MERDRYADTEFGAPRLTSGAHGYVAYYPRAMPRSIAVTPSNLLALADAEAALGRLAGVARLLPDPQLLVGPYLRREAVSSARIEGTQASLADVFDAEAGDAPLSADVEEVVNYVNAMEYGLARLATSLVSTRLLREIHGLLLAGVRGRERHPGELRRTQNWIGAPGADISSATFVPPPPAELGWLLDDLEAFIHEEPTLPPLVQAAMLHYQFETIHPFLDGNGRLGRLLVVFFLVVRGRLPEPLLYLSPFFEARRVAYYDALQGVRERGDFARWLGFYLEGVKLQAIDAVARAERLTDLREHLRADVGASTRSAAVEVVDMAFRQPTLTAAAVQRQLGISRPAALTALRRLSDLGVIVQISDGPRGQLRWRAESILAALTED